MTVLYNKIHLCQVRVICFECRRKCEHPELEDKVAFWMGQVCLHGMAILALQDVWWLLWLQPTVRHHHEPPVTTKHIPFIVRCPWGRTGQNQLGMSMP